MMSRNGRGSDSRGRSKGGPPFVQLFNYVVDSTAYARLSPAARATLIETCRLYNGKNNGHLAVPVRWLGERLGVSYATASRALTELDDLGFIRPTRMGSFTRKNRKATEYRLTFHRDDRAHQPPSKDFLSIGMNDAHSCKKRELRFHPCNCDLLNGSDSFTHATVSPFSAFPQFHQCNTYRYLP